MENADELPFKVAVARALMGRCPACGQGKLMRGYLQQVENCAACGESLGQIRADDAAPWATIILVGHVFLPLAFMVELGLPVWAEATVWSLAFAALSLAILPKAKAMFVAILWHTRAPGYTPVELV